VRGDEPVGLLGAYRFPDLAAGGTHVYLYDVEVREASRRRGVGASLLSALVQHCRADGVRRIWAGTHRGNAAARRAFESTGATLEGDAYVEFEWELEEESEAESPGSRGPCATFPALPP
jgi:GNAT superfamily N-acetyltransferase